MGKDIYEAIKPEQETVVKTKKTKVRKPINKDSLIIGIVVAVILLLTAGIVLYYFIGVNNEVLVTYDGGEITRGEYEAVYKYWAPTLAYYGYDTSSLSSIVVDEIMLNEVIYKEAREKGYTLSDEDKETVDTQFKDEDSIKALRSNGINPDILKDFFYKNSVVTAYLTDIEEGVTTEELKANIIASEGNDADLNLYKTSHILLQFTSDMTDDEKQELKTKAEDLLARAKKGEDFATLAEENSDDSSASNGGEFDMVNNDTVVENYKKAVLTLKAGQIYGSVVETEYGYHVIKLNSIEKEGRLTNSTDIDTYVNEYIEDAIAKLYDAEDEKHQAELEKVEAVATKLNSELGITSTTTEE